VQQDSVDLAAVLAAAAIFLAWFVFRIERYAARERDVTSALGTLRAVRRGMVDGFGQMEGWGEIYFSTLYGAMKTTERAQETKSKIKAGNLDQVLLVPTEPLAQLATAPPGDGLIAEETIAAANFALWRVEVFRQLVFAQTVFNASIVAELGGDDTTGERRNVLANAGAQLSIMLHAGGIGLANAEDGWYGRLKTALRVNIASLETSRGIGSYYGGRGQNRGLAYAFAIIDLLVVAGGVIAIIASV
jgi:hypothetical protein